MEFIASQLHVPGRGHLIVMAEGLVGVGDDGESTGMVTEIIVQGEGERQLDTKFNGLKIRTATTERRVSPGRLTTVGDIDLSIGP